MENQEKDQVIASLIESNDNLRGELAQLRNNNRILRRVHSALRSANQALRNQVAIAQQNDELFKELCTDGSYGAKVTRPDEGGLPEPGTQAEASG
jgi:hypothetical protein